MYLNGLDELDQKIVQLLIKNARFSYSDIGKEVGISRVAVKARIQALEKKRVIEEYTTIINPQKISGAISCYFEIETLSNSFTDVIEILNQNNIVTQIYRVTGKNKLHVHAVAASNSEMEDFLHTTIDTLPGVISCSCNIILSRIKDIKFNLLSFRKSHLVGKILYNTSYYVNDSCHRMLSILENLFQCMNKKGCTENKCH